MSKTILIVGGHAPNRELIREAIADFGCEISEASTASEALEHFRYGETALVVADVGMPGMSGMDLLEKVRDNYPETVVILVTAFATVANAVEAMRMGAYDYLTLPIDIDELRAVLLRALEYQELHSHARLSRGGDQSRPAGFEESLGNSKALVDVLVQASRAAQSNATVLIVGESGTGKELLARGIHANSCRSKKPFVTINCGAIPKYLMESELFGHLKGAFTGAVGDRRGQVEAASGGTLFLDEIGEMTSELQVKLLRLLQNGEIQKVGAISSTRVDVRVIAATHRDLAGMMHEGSFREDLYYRLNVIPLRLPSLRDRRKDIPQLLRLFFERSRAKHGRDDLRLSGRVLNHFLSYDWPGNIRELENVVERIVVLTPGNDVEVADLPDFLRPEPTPLETIGLDLPAKGISLGGLEKEVLLQALKQCRWNQSATARYLNLSRKTLIYRMHKYNLLQPEPLRIVRERPNVLRIA
jgi:two-component system NtrC family response regulator